MKREPRFRQADTFFDASRQEGKRFGIKEAGRIPWTVGMEHEGIDMGGQHSGYPGRRRAKDFLGH